ncbi:MAG TPA: phospholipase D-like domain-containing protein, partial [Trebonia sp.]
MRRLLVPAVLMGVAVALAGCKGAEADLGGSSGSGPGSGSATVQAAGPVSAGSGTLRVLAEPQAGLSGIYQLITGARSSIELTMYTLRDPTAEKELAAAAARGVSVRVILDQHLEKKFNTATYSYLKAHKVKVTWAPPGVTYHQKTLTVDSKTSVIMTLNMNSNDYPTTRDFAVFDTSKSDVAAVVTTFNADFAHKTRFSPPDGA